ncbi:PAS domain S-box-containing protein [Povalibacter uvarum]|uniref:histidine kinase n=1 Tax=Povalibacter uvarum TaxID=732238 RepID=A0A841HEZ2_9GAMM|nr:HWE histidine kinase domain-containing protein [Povalibacter uvarum]MBB6091681.1 PAS domain S-box-containing protein [Povalibacter uvarum]
MSEKAHAASGITGAAPTNAAPASESEQTYRQLFQAIDTGFCVIEVIFDAAGRPIDYVFRDANPAFEGQTGLADAIGKRIRVLAPGHEEFWFETYGRIVRTGLPERFEHQADALGRWYSVYAFRIGRPEQHRLAVLFDDIKGRRSAEEALRHSEERQVFLLKLSDTIRFRTDPMTIQQAAARLLGEHLDVSRAFYFAVRRDADGYVHVVERDYFSRPDLPSMVGEYPQKAYGENFFSALARGEAAVMADIRVAPGVTEDALRLYSAARVRAWISMPLIKRGNFTAGLVLVHDQPRYWTSAEVGLVKDVAERTWAAVEQARAEAALRATEERFRQFAEASSGALWIRDADTLSMEYASQAITGIYGVEPEILLGDVKRWAAVIVPDDRDVALEHLEQARRGEAAVHEFRIQRPSDRAFRWVRNTNFPLFDESRRVQRIGGIAEDVTDAKLAVEHQGVLLAELQHRVRNIMAIIRSITSRTGERAESVQDYATLMAGRLLALARVQALLTRAANAGVGITALVHDEVNVQAQCEGQFALEGPEISLSPKAAEILTLAVHELSTNALKYGALSVRSGKITVRWSTFDKRGGTWLSFDWTEEGRLLGQSTLNAPRRRGFGTELIEGRIPYELGGRGQLDIRPEGATCHLEFPLKAGGSVLETGAPQRATVFGGALDMTGEPDLSGRRVLVVEDDYYLAADVARALKGAGAEVMGPCATEAAVLIELNECGADAAVLDINLGPGPSFGLATTLKEQHTPFMFLTGYDLKAIPEEFADIERLEKPVQLRHIIGVIADLIRAEEVSCNRRQC